MSKSVFEKLPAVSIICPVYNGQDYIADLIRSLLALDYPPALLEIFIVDNHSRDRTREIVSSFPVTLLQENDIQSSYAARNQGIRRARGEILAFIDADCTPAKNWLRAGVETLLSESADLAGGPVKFVFPPKKTAAQIYDSLTHFYFETKIKQEQVTGAGNLFVKATAFARVGLFPPQAKSGGDFQWTRRATKNGLALVWAPHALVHHPARPLAELLKKRYRTGKGTINYWRAAGVSRGKIIAKSLRYCFPRRLSPIKKAIAERGTPDMNQKLWRLGAVAYLCNLSTAAGILISLFDFAQRKKTL